MFVKARLYVEYVDVTDSDGEIKTKYNERVISPFLLVRYLHNYSKSFGTVG